MVAPVVALLTLLLALAGGPAMAFAPAAGDASNSTTRVVVATRDGYVPVVSRVVSRQPNLGTLTADADDATLARLRRDPRVVAVTADRELRPALVESAAQIHAEAAWNMGLTGAGQTIAVIDTGVDGTHPMLSGHVVDEACFTEAAGIGGACPNGQATQLGAGAAAPCGIGGCDHGTHVASIAAGGSDGARRGIAPGASIIAVQVFTPTPEGPSTSIGEVLAAFEWVYEQRARFAIAAINLSVASAGAVVTPCADEVVEQAVQRLRAVGIAVVAAAGNSAAPGQLAYPACVPGVVSVSAVGATGTVSPFANGGPALSLFAPGETVVAAVPGGGALAKSGTSQAAPHVAGALAVLRQAKPSATVDAMIAHFDRTADAVTALDGRRAAAGLLRVDRALDPRYETPSVIPSRGAPPVVALQSLRVLPGRVELTGTLVDPASVLPATVVAIVDGRTAASVTTVDDGGDRQRFALSAPVTGGAEHEFCLDVRGGRALTSTRVVCAPVAPPDGQPFGALDLVEGALGTVVARGWAIDPNVSSAVDVHVYVDGRLVGGSRADRARGDVGAAYPDYGEAHGFGTTLRVADGPHELCVYAIDADDDENALVGCRAFDPRRGEPFGALDAVRAGMSGIVVAGWAIDPDTQRAIDVHVYVDGRLVRGATADRARRDVDAEHPAYAPDHGYEVTIDAMAAHTVCTYGINEGVGTNALLGCRTI